MRRRGALCMVKPMISELLGIRCPIFQGAMANIATPAFAAAVSNAGGLGIVATGSMKADQVRQALEECRTLTSQPFGVNVMLMNPEAEQIFEILCENPPAVVTTGAGNPGPWMARLRNAGICVIPVVSSVALARRLQKAGASAVIAEGCEAGGHIGQTTTMALVPQMCDALDIPVIAAGGIADGRGMAAALALGAQGVQVGTVLLASEECPIHEKYKNAVLRAKDSSTTVTGRSLNAQVRILKNTMAREYLRLEKAGADRMEMEKMTLGALRRAVSEGDVDRGSVMMGQIAGLVHEIRPVSVILQDLMEGAVGVLQERQPAVQKAAQDYVRDYAETAA